MGGIEALVEEEFASAEGFELAASRSPIRPPA
jgi:hypothetical protein